MKLRMVGRIETSLTLAYRTPAASVRHLTPPGLELTTRGDYAFWSIGISRISAMRPAGMPRPVGVSFHHVAYRLHVQAMTDRAEVVRGLYFVRSDADSTAVAALGNALSDFRFHPAAISLREQAAGCELKVRDTAGGRGDACLSVAFEAPAHDGRSCFPTPEDAQRVLRYQPIAMTPDGYGRLRLTEVWRDPDAWQQQRIAVRHARFTFLEALGQADLHLELATRIDPIDYRWTMGRRLSLLQAGDMAVESALAADWRDDRAAAVAHHEPISHAQAQRDTVNA